MATNTFKISDTTEGIYRGDKEYNEPGNKDLFFFLNEKSGTEMTVHIRTNYFKLRPHSLEDIYYHASEIEAGYYNHRRRAPLYSIAKESGDGKTLLITRRIEL